MRTHPDASGRALSFGPAPFHAGPPPEPPEFLGSWDWREPIRGETIRAWMERKARLADELVAHSRIWLRVGRKVRILHAPHLGEAFDGRYGIITSPGGETFPDSPLFVSRRINPTRTTCPT